MSKELDRIKLRLLVSLSKLGYLGKEEELLSLEYPDAPELRKLKLIAVVNHLDEQFRDPIDFLKIALNDEDDEVIEAAVGLVLELNDDRLMGELVPLLEDENEFIAHKASEIICKLRVEEKDLLNPLINLIGDEKKPVKARVCAIKALNYQNDSTLILDALISLLSASSLEIRMEAAKAIKYIIDHDLVLNSLLEKLLNDPEIEIELSLVWAISHIQNPKIVEYIKPYMEHEDLRFQEAAAFGLGNSGDENIIGDLINKLEQIEAEN